MKALIAILILAVVILVLSFCKIAKRKIPGRRK